MRRCFQRIAAPALTNTLCGITSTSSRSCGTKDFSVDDDGFVNIKVDKLERAAPLAKDQHVLSPKQRAQLTKFIYHAHYRPSGSNEADPLDKAELMLAQFEMRWIEEHFAGVAPDDQPVADTVKQIQRAVLERADTHKPIPYITGTVPFYNSIIKCEQPILVPRTETETWVSWLCEKHLKMYPGAFRVLDLCSGSGCIGVSIAKNNANAFVQAVDLDPQAVALSKQNALFNGVQDRHSTLQSDMLEMLLGSPDHEGQYDVIVCNPPYIHPNQWDNLEAAVRIWESPLALLGDMKRRGKMHYYLELIRDGPKLLRRMRKTNSQYCPHIVVEVGEQAELVASAFDVSGDWTQVNMHTDVDEKPRWVTAMLK